MRCVEDGVARGDTTEAWQEGTLQMNMFFRSGPKTLPGLKNTRPPAGLSQAPNQARPAGEAEIIKSINFDRVSLAKSRIKEFGISDALKPTGLTCKVGCQRFSPCSVTGTTTLQMYSDYFISDERNPELG